MTQPIHVTKECHAAVREFCDESGRKIGRYVENLIWDSLKQPTDRPKSRGRKKRA